MGLNTSCTAVRRESRRYRLGFRPVGLYAVSEGFYEVCVRP